MHQFSLPVLGTLIVLFLTGCGSSSSTRSGSYDPEVPVAGGGGSSGMAPVGAGAPNSGSGGRLEPAGSGGASGSGGADDGGVAGEGPGGAPGTPGGAAGSPEPGSGGSTSGGSAGEPEPPETGGAGGVPGGAGGDSGSAGSAALAGAAGSGGQATGGQTNTGGSSGSGGTSGAGGQPPVCPVGDKQCNQDGNVETCGGLAWAETEVCPFVCQIGACGGVCTPGSTQCSGNYVETCDASGQWQSATSECPYVCQSGACTGTCVPGTVECVGQDATRTCNAGGQWDPDEACPVPANSHATCSAGICGSACNAGYADCGGAADGCETTLGTTSDCLGCGDICDGAPANADNLCDPGGCVWECQATWDDCDGNVANGCEQDIWNDPLDCGVCGHSCWDGTCSAGVCSYDIEVVFESTNPTPYTETFTTYGPNVYWIDSINNGDGTYTNTVYTATDTDPTPVYLGAHTDTGLAPGQKLVTNGADLVWFVWNSTGTGFALYTMPTSGGTPTALFPNQSRSGDSFALAVDDTYAYWVNPPNPCNCTTDRTNVWKVPLTGGSPELVLDFWGHAADLYVDDTNVHIAGWGNWSSTTGYSNGSVWSFDKTGDPVADGFGSGYKLEEPEHLVSDGTYAIWVDDYGTLSRATLDDNSATSVTDLSPGNRFRDVEIDGSTLYLPNGSEIVKVGINGGPLTTVAAAAAWPIAVSDAYVYWRQPGPVGMTLLRAPR